MRFLALVCILCWFCCTGCVTFWLVVGETGAGAAEAGAGAAETVAGAGETGAGAGETGAGASVFDDVEEDDGEW